MDKEGKGGVPAILFQTSFQLPLQLTPTLAPLASLRYAAGRRARPATGCGLVLCNKSEPSWRTLLGSNPALPLSPRMTLSKICYLLEVL